MVIIGRGDRIVVAEECDRFVGKLSWLGGVGLAVVEKSALNEDGIGIDVACDIGTLPAITPETTRKAEVVVLYANG